MSKHAGFNVHTAKRTRWHLECLQHAAEVHKADIDNLTHQAANLAGGIKSIKQMQDEHTQQLTAIAEKVAGHEIQIKVLDATKSNKRKVK